MTSNGVYLQQNLAPELTAINTVFIGVATIAVACRFAARRLRGTGWWYDDWTALLALIFGWAFYGLVEASIPYGLGRHIDSVTESDQAMDMELLYVYQIFYCLIPVTIKVSALFLYRRIFVINGFIKYINGVFCVLMAWGVASILVDIFNCTPVEAFWKNDGTCVNLKAWVLGYAIPGILLDFVVWLTPIPLIWKLLNLSLHHKILLTVIFLIGLTDCAVDIARLAVITSFFGQPDFTYLYAEVQWWDMMHTSLGIIAICLPTMRILLSWVGNLFSKHSRLSSSEKVPAVNRRNIWKKSKKNFHELNEVGLSLSGDAERNIHNNTIALALRQPSQGTPLHGVGNNEIQVTRHVIVERDPPLEVPPQVHLEAL